MKTPHSIPVTFILEFDKESGYYASQIKEYPHVISQGKTKKEAINNAIDAFMEFIEMYKVAFRNSDLNGLAQTRLASAVCAFSQDAAVFVRENLHEFLDLRGPISQQCFGLR